MTYAVHAIADSFDTPPNQAFMASHSALEVLAHHWWTTMNGLETLRQAQGGPLWNSRYSKFTWSETFVPPLNASLWAFMDALGVDPGRVPPQCDGRPDFIAIRDSFQHGRMVNDPLRVLNGTTTVRTLALLCCHKLLNLPPPVRDGVWFQSPITGTIHEGSSDFYWPLNLPTSQQ